MVEDLHALLHAAGIPGPYVLVGHSLGGMNVRLYAHTYPADVAGLILVDSELETIDEREERELLPTPSAAESQAIKDERQFLIDQRDPSKNPEFVDHPTTYAQIRAITSLGSVPLVVIAHGKPFPLPPEMAAQYEQLWQALQKDLTRLSSQSSFLIATESDHGIPDEQPQIIIDAIRTMIDSLRKQ